MNRSQTSRTLRGSLPPSASRRAKKTWPCWQSQIGSHDGLGHSWLRCEEGFGGLDGLLRVDWDGDWRRELAAPVRVPIGT